jgi:ADP-ribosylglycohydrolase
MNTLQDRIRGSFIGGAAGDALGYPVEFLKDFKKIRDVYGENGITKLTPPW